MTERNIDRQINEAMHQLAIARLNREIEGLIKTVGRIGTRINYDKRVELAVEFYQIADFLAAPEKKP